MKLERLLCKKINDDKEEKARKLAKIAEEKENLSELIKEIGGLWTSEDIDREMGKVLSIKEKREALKIQK